MAQQLQLNADRLVLERQNFELEKQRHSMEKELAADDDLGDAVGRARELLREGLLSEAEFAGVVECTQKLRPSGR